MGDFELETESIKAISQSWDMIVVQKLLKRLGPPLGHGKFQKNVSPDNLRQYNQEDFVEKGPLNCPDEMCKSSSYCSAKMQAERNRIYNSYIQ